MEEGGLAAAGSDRAEGHARVLIKHHFHAKDAPARFHEFGGVGFDDVKSLLRQNIFSNRTSRLNDGFFLLTEGDEVGI